MAAMIITVETEARSNNSLFPLSNNTMTPAGRISVALSKTNFGQVMVIATQIPQNKVECSLSIFNPKGISYAKLD